MLLLPVSEQFISAGLEGVLVKTFSELDFGNSLDLVLMQLEFLL